MTVIDARAITEPRDADEALAFFLCYAEPDDVISLHGLWCRTQIDCRHDCTCTPVSMRLGARA